MKKIVFFFSLFFLSYSFAFAKTQPKDVINYYIDEVVKVINNAQTIKNREKKALFLKKKLREIGDKVFLFEVMARMTLGYKWRTFSKEQKKEFKELFIKFIEKNYFDKLLDYLEKKKSFFRKDIVITGQKMLTDIKAEVSTIIKYEDKEIPVKYRLVRLKNGWKVYDVYVEGVGLIQNYRKQFRALLRNRTPEEFLKIFKSKVEEENKNEKKN